jgi:DNA-binding NarL/FixJ family response regulator
MASEPLSSTTTNSDLIWKRSSKRMSNDMPKYHAIGVSASPEVVGRAPKAIDAAISSAFVVIEKRAFLRECFVSAMRSVFKQDVLAYPTIESWLNDTQSPVAVTIVMYVGSRDHHAEQVKEQLTTLARAQRQVSVALLCDDEDPDRIFDALERGVRGYILTSSPLDLALEALRLVAAGGTFVPASSFVEARRSRDRPVIPEIGGMRLTARQMAVIDGLRRGKANKVIAYELNMRESTVKVHVRNIMKKLNARNRTQVAFIANGMPEADGR